MTTRTARGLLAVVVLATSLLAIRYYDGHDFINSVWAPTRGLVDGLDPYDPADSVYPERYHVPVVSGLYLPAALLLHAPLALLSALRSADVMAILNAALLWCGVLLLIPPRRPRACLVAGVVGTFVIGSAAAQDTIYLGQLSGWAFAGLALLVASLRDRPSAVWLPAIAASLVALKPQSAIPLLAGLFILGYGTIAARAAAILTVASLPGVALFIRATGSPLAVFRVAASNLTLLSALPPTDLANPSNLRTDALGLVSHLHGPALTGPGWLVASFFVTTILFVLAARGSRRNLDPFFATLLGLYVLAALYHLMYDQLLLYVGPVAATAPLARSDALTPRTRVTAIGGVALALAGVVFREGMRVRWVALGLPELLVRQAWVAVPTLVGLGVVVWGLAHACSNSGASYPQ